MKKLICLVLVFAIMLTACSKPEEKMADFSESILIEEGLASDSFSEAEDFLPCSEEGVFCSNEALVKHLLENLELCEYLKTENEEVFICVPKNLPEKYKLNMIRISGSYITYYYENPENTAEFFNLEWPFKVTDAEKSLQNSLNFTYSEIAERPGSYVSSVYSIENGEQEAFKILWTEEGFCFSAIVSEEIFNSFKSGTDLVKRESYSIDIFN